MAVVTIQQSVAALYVAVFNRAPDAAGLNAWTAVITSGQQTFAQVAAGFAAHEVFTTGIGTLSNTDFVAALYQNILGSAGDAGGIANWSNQLNAGMSKADVAALFVQAALTVDIPAMLAAGSLTAAEAAAATVRQQTLTNKADVGIYFANTLGAASNLNPNTVSSSKAGLEADPIYNASKAAIANVTDSPASVAAAKDAIAVAAGSSNPAQALLGGTFTLTAGADTIVGGAASDVINALTVQADGGPATTLSAFDSIDGGAGNDTLNIYSDGTDNVGLNGATVKNVETININNSGAGTGFGAVDASKFVGATAINQVNIANAVTGLAAGTVAGFKGVTATGLTALSVTAATAAASASVQLDAVKGAASTNVATATVAGDALNSVTVAGTLAQTTVNATAASLALGVTAGKDVQTLTVNSAVKTTLTVTEGAGTTQEVKTVDASASAGDISYLGTVINGANVATIKTGAGADTVTIATVTVKDDATTTADETVSALLETGAGVDNLTINTSGTGTTTVNAGEGNDTVTLTTDGSGKLTVNLGAGNDTFKGAGSVAGTDAIDGGAGTDTLQLNMVGAANIGAFSNFETFDAVGLGKTLDVEILAAKNTVTEFVTTGDVGTTAVLTNVGAGVGYRVTGDTAIGNALTLTQKTAGALTVTLDIDETGTTAATTASTARDASVVASNATSVKAVFDSAFVGAATGVGDNTTNLAVTGATATSLDVVSGGANASNVLNYTIGNVNAKGALTSITVSGDQALSLDLNQGTTHEVTSVDASALKGALTFNLNDLKAESAANKFDGGVLKLGAGDDVITGVTGGVISGIAKGTVEDAAKQEKFDIVNIAGAVQAADVAANATITVKDGLLTFNGTGPATLDAAIALAATATTASNAAVAFEYVGNSYIYATGAIAGAGADDVVIQLAGVTGLHGLDNVAAGNLYVI